MVPRKSTAEDCYCARGIQGDVSHTDQCHTPQAALQEDEGLRTTSSYHYQHKHFQNCISLLCEKARATCRDTSTKPGQALCEGWAGAGGGTSAVSPQRQKPKVFLNVREVKLNHQQVICQTWCLIHKLIWYTQKIHSNYSWHNKKQEIQNAEEKKNINLA